MNQLPNLRSKDRKQNKTSNQYMKPRRQEKSVNTGVEAEVEAERLSLY